MKTLTYIIPEPTEVVRDKIAAQIQGSLFRWPWQEDKLFYGKLSANGFRLVRITYVRNTAMQVAVGRMESCLEGTKVVVELRPRLASQLFSLWWYGFGTCIISAWLVSSGSLNRALIAAAFGIGFVGVTGIVRHLIKKDGEAASEFGFEVIFQGKAKRSD